LLLLPPSGKSGKVCARAFPLKTWKVSLSIGVRITMIRCVVYLLRIFKMFHGLMNNPVLRDRKEEERVQLSVTKCDDGSGYSSFTTVGK
jgi:hypothetical protein